jgi:hypothetical protein
MVYKVQQLVTEVFFNEPSKGYFGNITFIQILYITKIGTH